jgi:hypothetical protein
MAENFLEYAVRASMVDMLDKKLLVLLDDGRSLIGTLMCVFTHLAPSCPTHCCSSN